MSPDKGTSKKPRVPEPKLVVLSAPSGAGKSTLAAMLLARHPNLALSISYTTRQPRGDEKHGVEYFFVSQEEFSRMVREGLFLEYAMVFGKNWYGTSRQTVEDLLSHGKSVVFDVDVQGAHALKKAYGSRCLTVFILPPSFEELEARLRNRRTETPEAIETRLNTAREELRQADQFDVRVVNRELEAACREIEAALMRENCI